jgi:septal ring factor EnvC (AmiA/AmiB activator)
MLVGAAGDMGAVKRRTATKPRTTATTPQKSAAKTRTSGKKQKSGSATTKPRSISTVKREQNAAHRAIQQTAAQIEANKLQTRRSLSRLDALNAEIAVHNRTIGSMTSQIDSINSNITLLNDSVTALEGRLEKMRESYARIVRKIHERQRGATSSWAFIFSAETVSQGYRRMRYLQEVSAWRTRRSREISAQADSLRQKRTRLAELQSEKTTSLRQLNTAREQLRTTQTQTSQIVEKLKKENTSLRLVLSEKEAQARALDAELDRLIAEEQRRQEAARQKEEARRQKDKGRGKAGKEDSSPAPADTKSDGTAKQPAREAARTYATADETRTLSGSFESNKGRLLFPVSGRYRVVRGFGRQQHPDLPHVVIDNAGIDIEVSSGATARAVYAGKVSAIFRQPGYNTIVMVRHGKYLTVYAGLDAISVSNGQELRQGQTIGKIFADPDDNNRAVLHFELRCEKEKLNPQLWVK